MTKEENMILHVHEVNGKILGQDGETIEDDYLDYNKRTKETKAVAKEAEDQLVKTLELTFRGGISRVIEQGEIHRANIEVDSKILLFPRLEMIFVLGERIVHPDEYDDDFKHDIWASLQLMDRKDKEYIGLSREFEYQLDKKEWVELTTGMEDEEFGRISNDK